MTLMQSAGKLRNMVFEQFDRIRIVNLVHRTDRRAEMEAQLARIGLSDDKRVEYFGALSFTHPGIFKRRGSHGAFKSHLALLSAAADAEDSILILQDDCNFILPDVLNYEMPKCDVFYGGYAARNPADLHKSDIIGAHFMGFSAGAAKAAAEYLTAYLERDFQPDPIARKETGFDPNIRPPIDGALVWFRRANPQLKTEFAMLSYQRSSRTDIGSQKWFDRIPILRKIAGSARKYLRRPKVNRSGEHVFREP